MGRRNSIPVLVLLFAFAWIGQLPAHIPLEPSDPSPASARDPAPAMAPVTLPTLMETPVGTQDPVPPETPAGLPPAAVPPQPTIEAPEDPCLPGLYKDWQEMSRDSEERGARNGFASFRIVIDRSNFQLSVLGVRKDGTADAIYTTYVGLGDVSSPTPEGDFVINHIYCYPDVLYFDASGEKVPGLYDGFFAPLLFCDEYGHCKRFRDLGMHGFQGAAARAHNVHVSSTAAYGAISAGCIRVPDPCRLKSELIRLAGIGPLKRNDRGTYHWLARPIEVIISGNYPGTDEQTLVSIFQQGVEQVHDGLRNLFGIFGR